MSDDNIMDEQPDVNTDDMPLDHEDHDIDDKNAKAQEFVSQAMEVLEKLTEDDDNFTEVPGTDGKLSIKLLKKGASSASAKRPSPGDHIVCHYDGRLHVDGKTPSEFASLKQFDSSRNAGRDAFEFDISQGSVIKAWDMGLLLYTKGMRALIKAHPDYAYGSRAMGADIPANSTLIFDVELLKFGKKPVAIQNCVGASKVIIDAGKGSKLPRYESSVTLDMFLFKGDSADDSGACCGSKQDWTFVLGCDPASDLPDGVEAALQTMREGEVATITFTRSKGYFAHMSAVLTNSQAPAKNDESNVVFTLKVALKAFDVVSTFGGTPSEKLESTTQRKDEGNGFVSKGLWRYAQRKYERALEFIGDDAPLGEPAYGFEDATEEEQAAATKLRVIVLQNLALVLLKQNNAPAALFRAREALKHDATAAKAKFRAAQALSALGDWDEAIAALKALPQDDAAVAAELAAVRAIKAAQNEKDKKIFAKMFQ